jgi:hypothetical protein
MRTKLSQLIVAMSLAAASSIVLAQNAPPARETPRPQDVDPAVDTSATPPARETPRPQDVEPRVNTSAPAQLPATSASPTSPASPASEAAPGDTGGADSGAAAPGATPSSKSATPSKSANPASAKTAAAANGASERKGKALDRIELDTTEITGNRELPKVLYIVPWKRSDLGDLVGKPVNSLLDEVLTPVDRDVFQRENRYYRALTPGAAENDALSAADGRPTTPVRKPTPTNGAPAPGSPGSATYRPSAPAGGVSTGSGSGAPPARDEK